MTNAEAAERQATHENLFSCCIRPETAAALESVLDRMNALDCDDGYKFWRELGALKWDAFAALCQLQADQKVFKEFGRVQ